jgi:hypothetical protein
MNGAPPSAGYELLLDEIHVDDNSINDGLGCTGIALINISCWCGHPLSCRLCAPIADVTN